MSNRTIKIEEGTPGYAAVNPYTNIMYISYPFSNFILVVNISKGFIHEKIVASSPGNIVVNQVTNKVYVSSADGIYEFDGSTDKHQLINAGRPHANGNIDINQVTNILYTTCFDSGDNVTIIDADNHSIINKIEVRKKSRYSPGYHGTHVFLKLYGITVHSSENKVFVANYEEKSISIFDFEQSEKPINTILMKATNPRFLLVNDVSNLLYVLGTSFVPYTASESFGIFDINTGNEIVGRHRDSIRPTPNSQVGIAFNRISNTVYMKKDHEMAIMKLDAYARKVLNSTTFENRTFWQRFYEGFGYFAEVIAVNSVTNKIYVSDSKNSHLYEIDS